MKRQTLYVLGGYAAFCAVNWLASYSAARSGSPLLLGSAALLNLNESLRKFNLVSYMIDPVTAAEKTGAAAPAAPGSTYLPAAAPLVTQQPTGTTTYYGPS